MKNLRLTSGLFAIAIPVITGSVMLPTVAEAATFAFSSVDVVFTNFNQSLESSTSRTVTNTTTEAVVGSVTANSIAQAEFLNSPPQGQNFAESEVAGDGSNYQGNGQALSEIIGQFFIPETITNPVFRFNFSVNLDLEATIDDPTTETAQAIGKVVFSVFAGSQPDNQSLVDLFVLSGGVDNSNQTDFLKIQGTENVNYSTPVLSTTFGGFQESVLAVVNGSYERHFTQGTYITLVETKSTNTNTAAVPEPSTLLAVAISGVVGLVLKRRKPEN